MMWWRETSQVPNSLASESKVNGFNLVMIWDKTAQEEGSGVEIFPDLDESETAAEG